MSEQRILRNTSLKERIDRAEYHVDVDKVAEAILDRAAVRRLILPSEALSAQAGAGAEVGLDRLSSQDVLEAA
jgi:hypothetical protein